MGLLNIESLEEGMQLAADAHDRNGRLLLTQGTELTSRHIRMFMTWGITRVDVLNHDEPLVQAADGDELPPELLQKAEEELKQQFRKNDLDYPPLSELFKQCLIRKVRNENR